MIEDRNSLVYDRFIIPVELHYYGITDDLKRRGKNYKDTSLQQYIDEYGWDNINTTIVAEGLTRKEAEQLEDQLIREGWEKGYCVNWQGSGGEWRDNPSEYGKKQYQHNREEKLEYRRQYYKEHKEEKHKYYQDNIQHKKDYDKQRCSTPDGKIYYRVKSFNRRHPDSKTETPKEARQKYLETGYIPSYIKNNDLK